MIELGLSEALRSLPPVWQAVMAILTDLGGYGTGMALAVCLSIYDRDLLPVFAVGATIGIITVLKYEVFESFERPDGGTGSFPSGHAATAVVVWGLFAHHVEAVDARVRWGLAGSLAAIVAVSRVVLGRHYVIDVLAGAVVGGIVLELIRRERVFSG